MSKLVNALFLSVESAQQAINELEAVGISHQQISVLMSDATRLAAFGPGEVVENAHETSRDAAVGGVIGMVLAGIVTIGAFAVSGPLAALLFSVSGGIGGSLAGSLIGAGLAERRAHDVSQRLKDGGLLVAVDVDEKIRGEVAKILRDAGGEFVQFD